METTIKQITMKERNERILAECNNLATQSDFKSYEDTIDQMILCYLEDENSPEKSNAYFLAMNLKRLLKVSCEGFMQLRNENYAEFERLKNKIHS